MSEECVGEYLVCEVVDQIIDVLRRKMIHGIMSWSEAGLIISCRPSSTLVRLNHLKRVYGPIQNCVGL